MGERLQERQYGFRKGKSTVQAVLDMVLAVEEVEYCVWDLCGYLGGI